MAKNPLKDVAAGISPRSSATYLGATVEAVLQKKNENALDLIHSFVTEAEERGKLPVMMIDEANYFASNVETNQTIMKKLVARTNQTNRLSVLLISYDHTLPFDNLGVKLNGRSRTMLAGELSPDRMRRHFLVEKRGINATIAQYCLGVHGGHVYNTYRALNLLRDRQAGVPAFATARRRTISDVVCCLEAEDGHKECLRELKKTFAQVRSKEDLANIKDVLRNLAASGFVPFESFSSTKAHVLSKYNIAAVVDQESVLIGLDPSCWDETSFKYALVPSSQFMRMSIARELVDRGLLKKRE